MSGWTQKNGGGQAVQATVKNLPPPPKREEGLNKEEAERVMHSLKGALGKRGES
jgi:hypothetical protein